MAGDASTITTRLTHEPARLCHLQEKLSQYREKPHVLEFPQIPNHLVHHLKHLFPDRILSGLTPGFSDVSGNIGLPVLFPPLGI